jgi:uncharacterized protein (DUF433 family)
MGNLLERITVNPKQCGGRPCIRGMRIRVTDILGMLAEGVSHETILHDFPDLDADDIKAALAYAARQSDHAWMEQKVLEAEATELSPLTQDDLDSVRRLITTETQKAQS